MKVFYQTVKSISVWKGGLVNGDLLPRPMEILRGGFGDRPINYQQRDSRICCWEFWVIIPHFCQGRNIGIILSQMFIREPLIQIFLDSATNGNSKLRIPAINRNFLGKYLFLLCNLTQKYFFQSQPEKRERDISVDKSEFSVYTGFYRTEKLRCTSFTFEKGELCSNSKHHFFKLLEFS